MSEPARQGASQPNNRSLDQALLAKMCDLRLRIHAAKAVTNMIGLRPDLLPELLPKLQNTLDAPPTFQPNRQPPPPASAALRDPKRRLHLANPADTYLPKPQPEPDPEPGCQLPPMRLKVLNLIAEGHTRRQIARTLHLSEATIKTHTEKLLNDLQAPSQASAVAKAFREGIIK